MNTHKCFEINIKKLYLNIDRTTIDNYIFINNITAQSSFEIDSKNTDKSLEKIIKNIGYQDHLVILGLHTFGNSTKQIIRNIKKLIPKAITLHIANKKLIINPQNKELYELLNILLNLEEAKIEKKIDLTKQTLTTNGKKQGRKSGKKTKSMFDKYKRKILKLEEKGFSKRRIIDEIGIGTPQALGNYLRKIKSYNSNRSSLNGFFEIGSKDIFINNK